MTLRKRDRIVLAIVAAAALLGAFYMLALKPERQQASALESQIATQRQALVTAQQSYTVGRAAQAALKTDGAEWAALKLAVPEQSNIPALLRTLEKSATPSTSRCSRSALRAPRHVNARRRLRRPQRPARRAAATPVPIQLTFSGGYVALNKLVSKLTGSRGDLRRQGPRDRSAAQHRQRESLPARRS